MTDERSGKLVRVPHEEWPAAMPKGLVDVWRSQGFLVQVFDPKDGAQRLTVCRTKHNGKSWVPGITWDELQQIKAECGNSEVYAVEIFPAESDLVNVANMRHLWLLNKAPDFAWRKS